MLEQSLDRMDTVAPRQWLAQRSWFILMIALALVAKLTIALNTVGTNDALTWLGFLKTLHTYGGIGLYHRVELFNHPPFMIHVLRVMGLLTSYSGLPFYFWLRLPAILADVASAFLLWQLLVDQRGKAFSPGALLLLAVAPASLMISGFHGNTDPLMICFVLLAVWLFDRGHSVWLVGLAFGMSMNIKVLPVIFLPAFLLNLPHFRQRLIFVLTTSATFVVGGTPFTLQDPLFIVRRLFGYDSVYGQWGVARILEVLATHNTAFGAFNFDFRAIGKYVVLAVIVIASIWMSRLRYRPTMFTQCGVVALIFMTLTPGFGVQYLAWLIPWVADEYGAAFLYYATSGLFLFLIYNDWAGTFPWVLAVSFGARGRVIYAGLLCWASVAAVLLYRVLLLRRSAIESDVV